MVPPHLLTSYQKNFRHGVKPTDPKTYELVVNYRSHGGIVNCARSVIELIMLYWPHSIDTLQPERASVQPEQASGLRPIFFSSQDNVISPLIPQWLHQPTEICTNRMILGDLSSAMVKGYQLSSEQINVNT